MVSDNSYFFHKLFKKGNSDFVRSNSNRAEGRRWRGGEIREDCGISFPFCYLQAHLNQLLLFF